MRLVVSALASSLVLVATLPGAGPAAAEQSRGSASSWTYVDPVRQPRWDPCQTISYRVNDARLPGAAVDVHEALWRVGQVSGLVFEDQGSTDFVPTQAQPNLPGTDLVVAWVRPSESDAWKGFRSAGFASARFGQGHRPDGSTASRIVDGYLVLDPDVAVPAGFTSSTSTTRGEVLMHEAGHVVGLGHVDDPDQLMDDSIGIHQGVWGAGDESGLRAVGAQGGCLYASKEQAAAGGGSVPPQPPRPGSSASPGPSPSPAPSSSPTAAPRTPVTLSLAPATISAGEATTVTYRGTPGAVLDVLSRTQPSTVFTRIASVTLGPDGTATTSHKPQKNTRITAREADGTMSSTAPIIAVRSVASFSASRVGTRTYTFTGRVYPALANRLVSLYRNGTLVAQGRCDASGIYRITKTLAGGTFTFQVRTADDQDNLGTRSRELSLLVR